MGDIIIIGIPASLLLIALVQLAKRYIVDRWIPLLSVILGALIGIASALIDLQGGGYQILEYAIKGIVLGLTSAGLYDVGKKTILDK
jgi:hypothetical protein